MPKKNRAETRQQAKKKRARRLRVQAPSGQWQRDIDAGREPYPSDLMPLSESKVLDALPGTIDNYNPTGERGEQRHTPRHNVREEDRIDSMSPADVDELTKGWPSSIGSCFDGRGK